MKIDKTNNYIKILETPKIEFTESKDINFDYKTKELIEKIINSNTAENNKLILNNLKDFKIKKNSWFIKIFINPVLKLKNKEMYGCYNLTTNKIYLHKENEKVLGHELVHMASSIVRDGIIYSGFSQNFNLANNNHTIGIGLTEGYTSLESERLFGAFSSPENMSDRNIYDIEKDITRKLEQIVGQNKLKNYFYNANLLELVKELKNYGSIEEVLEFITDIDSIFNIKLNKKEYKDRIQELTKGSYLKLYKWNSLKRKEEFDKGLITEEEYKEITLNFSQIYTLDVMRLFDFNTEKIIGEEERKL